MNRIEKLWDRIERPVIYVVLFTFSLSEFLSIFFKKLSDVLDNKGALVMIALVMLAIFRFIDKNINVSKRNELTAVTQFTTEILNLFKRNHYKEIKILATNSYRYYNPISESKIKIDKLILLLRSYDDFNNIQFPVKVDDKQSLKQSSNNIIADWILLKNQGYIKKIEIWYYSFDCLMHYIIIDNEMLHFGLLKPITDFPGTQLNGSYIIHNDSKNGIEIIKSFNDEFSAIKEGFSVRSL